MEQMFRNAFRKGVRGPMTGSEHQFGTFAHLNPEMASRLSSRFRRFRNVPKRKFGNVPKCPVCLEAPGFRNLRRKTGEALIYARPTLDLVACFGETAAREASCESPLSRCGRTRVAGDGLHATRCRERHDMQDSRCIGSLLKACSGATKYRETSVNIDGHRPLYGNVRHGVSPGALEEVG